ncbi:hypothetical protein BDK92_4804 [Micromonospora pisi]|uniref:Uncharacterized protein n=1 Tax=Micromonospora pisi TaxID=589240 RepID=A0A495JNL9_9ACTN|nr:hypothetical protein [Micromonospora pisi]RKR90431.1 hypothetical protein BDK92_4804 [Micromonospora pisi]
MSAGVGMGTSGAGAHGGDVSWREVEQQRWEDRWAEYGAGYGIEVGEWGPDADGRVSFTNMVRVDGSGESHPSVLIDLHQSDATPDGYGWGQVMLSLQEAHHLHQRLGRLIYQATYGGELE